MLSWYNIVYIFICYICKNTHAFSDASSSEQALLRSQALVKGIKPEEIALLQFDSRELDNYWLTSAVFNDHYAKKHGHKFLYYSLTEGLEMSILCRMLFMFIVCVFLIDNRQLQAVFRFRS